MWFGTKLSEIVANTMKLLFRILIFSGNTEFMVFVNQYH